MSRTILLLVLWLSILVSSARSAAASTCSGTPGPSGTIELKMGAFTRTFVVRVPATDRGRTPGPLIFLFHPFGMNAQYMQGRVQIPRVWPEAIAVYPNGLPRLSGTGGVQPAWQTRPGELDDRDLVFFDAMLDWLRANHCFDEHNVFVMGYSNGAGLASVLACERAGVVAGFAIASGSLACTPSEPRPVILGHGLRDSTVGYDRAVDAARAWASRNGCGAAPKSGVPGCFVSDSCSGAPVTLCSYDGGHEYNEPFTRALVEFFKLRK
jgi:polyhydroxybutyrate depolymerase